MREAPTCTSPPATTPRRPGRELWILAVVTVLAITPIVASALRVGSSWLPTGDEAAIVLRGDDLFTSDTPLLGMPSTAGEAVDADVRHPGPLESQFIGVLSSLSDSPRTGLIAVTLVNIAAVVCILHWSRRLGGRSLLVLSAFVLAVTCWSLRGPILVTPFNPYTAVLPFLAFLVALVAILDDHPWAVAPAVFFGSWAAQAHLAVLAPVAAAALACAAMAAPRWWARRRSHPNGGDRTRLVVPWAVAGVVLALCWVLPVLDAVANGGGNVAAIVRAGGSVEDTIGPRGSLDVITNTVGVLPVWAEAHTTPLELVATPSLLAYGSAVLIALLGALVAVRSFRDRPALSAAFVLAAVSLVAGGLVTAKIPEFFLNRLALHNYLWLWAVSAFLWTAVVAGLALHLRAGPRSSRRHGSFALAAGGAALVLVAVLSCLPADRRPANPATTYAGSIDPQVVAALDRDERYVVELESGFTTFTTAPVAAGLVFSLERQGFDVSVPQEFAKAFGPHRARAATDEDRRLEVVATRDAPEEPTDGSTIVGRYEPTPELIARRDRLEEVVISAIEEQGRTTLPDGSVLERGRAREFVESGQYVNMLDQHQRDEIEVPVLPESIELRNLWREEPMSYLTVVVRPPGGVPAG